MNLPKNYNKMLEWVTTELGEYALEEEAKKITNIINEDFFQTNLSNNILIITESTFAIIREFMFVNQNKFSYQFFLFPLTSRINYADLELLTSKNNNSKNIFIVSSKDKLPIDNDSIDLAILPHSLENTLNPEEVLREIHRILRPEAKVIITGFNLYGFWGIWRLIAKIFIKSSLWSSLFENNFFSIGKVFNWLNVLGFNDLKKSNCCYNLPINNKKFLKNFNFLQKINKLMPFIIGNVYVICGCKKMIPLTPIKSYKWDKVTLTDNELAKNI